MNQLQKFQDLEVNHTYCVLGYEAKNSKFGDSYALKIKDVNSESEFEIWSTNSLAQYITNFKPTNRFTFTVKVGENNIKYPVIDGNRRERNYKMLQ